MTIKFGVIGLGNRGSKFAIHSLIPHPEIEVVMVSDVTGNHFDMFEERNIPQTKDYHELLKNPEVEAIFIATPDGTHGEIVLEAIKYQKHIICEKPLEITEEKVRELEIALVNYEKVFLVGYVLRYAPLYAKAKELLKSGIIGDIYLANGIDHIHYGGYAFFHDWHRTKEKSQSLLLQKSSHSLDILNWMIDSEPIQVAGLGGLDVFGAKGAIKKFGKPLDAPLNCKTCPIQFECEESIININRHKQVNWQDDWPDNCVFDSEIDVQDNQALLVNYQNNVKLTYSICQFSAYYRREFQFFGHKGELYFDDERNQIIVNDRLKREEMVYTVVDNGGHGGGDDEMIQEFLYCVEGEMTPRSDLRSSASVTRLVLSAQEAIDTNQIVKIQKGEG
ncbi:Gfo/Idh/MocA family protein [Vagococcus carniphilus]|uniref:Inositol 2-dehydrogenase n=1 Tax=Vagococcus carniphilus TaxID=218144 RepID=A0A430B3E3_9ENTE|nr:Gfo/Idh/MocA family oxidoreductase [Vagococcus carniphilus]QNN73373.1 Gfo/Idh/MocA family oxidoreductase [Vagococcus carniphilus]RSU14866.1 inositol 2-dehydrogenase [Vagococcus carniphilus]